MEPIRVRQRTEKMEIWTSQGTHFQGGEYVNENDSHARKTAQQSNTKAANKNRDRAIFILLGLLFLKFSVLLVLIVLMFTFFNGHILELQRNVGNLNKIIPPCESGWLQFEDHCYYFSKSLLTNWTQAEKMCVGRGSHLVIVTSQEEQEFLQSRSIGRLHWIGLTDLETEGTFKWIDGTGLSYTFWSTGEPNDLGGDEDCVQIHYEGPWNDSICNLNSSYAICEKRRI